MIIEAHGDLLRADVDALVNTVNTTGVMGKGIALQFKRAYPAMFAAYRSAAKAGSIELGRIHTWETGQLSGPRFVFNFPTKRHWKSPSRLVDIEGGLEDLVRVVRANSVRSIAIPPLGCGNGGLNWRDVEPLIRNAFKDVPETDVYLYAPEGAPAADAIPVSSRPPAMTPGRAALVELIHEYTQRAFGAPGLIETQKLMYFLQAAGEPLNLRFTANHYGPYADNLRHVLATVEGHYIVGFGDGSASVQDAEPLRVVSGADELARSELADKPDTHDRIRRVLELTEGYESAYGLELLATVHWVSGTDRASDDDELVNHVRDWSPRKAGMFTDQHIHVALQTLRERGWDSVKVSA